MDDDKLTNSDDFTAEVQGHNKNLYLIVFEKDDSKDYITDLKAALDSANEDEILKGYDIFQDSFDNSFEIKIGQIDMRDQTNFKDALDLIGATDSNFKLTFPVTLIVRKGVGKLASLTSLSNNGKLSSHLRDKIIETSGAKKKKADSASGGSE